MQMQTERAVIADESATSGVVKLTVGTSVGIIVPTIDTASVYIQVSADGDAASPTYVRLQKEDGSADWSLASGTGGKAIWFPNFPFKWLKIETSANQTTGDKTFIVTNV